ncbi:coiled-coil domain-containing protein AGAP005037-like isoform X4 [Argiope bruennichi]|uniref:coiled-coil domain-containing protein AGAP005037-like isoform X4 n=1 Tax=Argiope bruennichi TaxID=94029 RepID=UPI0024945D00|nr:coiled-coil domain-containing protein AGAP005037-like isoform X4 [Argiope bruennichi]
MKMPFSIKRFTIHRSSSLPTHGGSKKESSSTKEASVSKKGDKKPSSRPRGLPTSQSVDTADLRRYNNHQEAVQEERVPPLPPHDRSRQFDYDPRKYAGPEERGPRWRNKERGPRLPGDMGPEVRRVMVRRNGVRFQDSDWATEESQSTSSSSGGGTARDYLDEPRTPARDGRWGNGRRGGRSSGSSRGPGDWSEEGANGGPRHSGKRSQGRRHHQPQESTILHDARPPADMENAIPGRHPLYTPSYDEDPGIMSEVETSATGFRTIRAPKTPRIASFPPPSTRGGKAPPLPPDRHTMGPVSPQLRHENLTLGLVFLQYRSETKRALLPNEITTLDTVKALFVRSFPKQLTMEYLDSPHIRIYIHDPAKDMFYELEDLRDIRDRSVLRIYEQEPNGEVYSTWEGELSYFSEPEFDSEYQNQHIHRAKGGVGYYGAAGLSAYCPLATQTLPPGPYSPPDRTKPPIAYAQTLPWGAHLTYAPSGPPSPERRPKEILIPPGVMQPPPKPQRSFQQGGTLPIGKGIRCTPPPPTGPPPSIPSPRSGMPRPMVETRVPPFPRYAPERRHEPQGGYRPPPERPYSAGAQPIYTVSPERHYEPTYRKSFEGGYLSSPERRYEPARAFAAAAAAPISPYEEPYYGGTERIYGSRSGSVTPVVDEEARLRVEHMERQLASLTGLVQKALTAAPIRSSPQNQQIPTRDISKERGQGEGFSEARSSKSSSCTSLADENSESQPEPHSKYAFKVERPVKPAIKSSLSLRSQPSSDVDSVPTQLHPPTVKVTSADREPRSKPAPPPKPSSLSERQHSASPPTKGKFRVSVEMYSQLRHLRKQTKDLRLEVRNLRRIAQSQAITAKETVKETCLKIKTMLAAAQMGEEHVCAERLKVSREEELYRQDVNHLERDLLELESQVEELRGNVINRKCRVNLGDVEGMALVLSRASKAVAELKARFPALQESLKTIMAVEMEVVCREEKFLKDEPERLENALRRCKKLTGTLVTLKRLASVQEQRHTVGHHLPEKSHSADGPHSDGEMHSTKSSRQGWKRSSNFKEKIDMWRGYSTLGWADQPRGRMTSSLNPLQSLSLDGGTHTVIHVPPADGQQQQQPKQQTALDALLSELQTFNHPAEPKQQRDNIPGLLGPQRRLPSYPSADSPVRSPIHGMPQARSPTNLDPGAKTLQVTPTAKSLSPTPQERKPSPTSQLAVKTIAEVLQKKVPPPPPPRTTSRSPVTSPTEAVTATTAKAVPLRSALAMRNPPPQRSSSVPTPRGSSHPTLRQTASTRPSSRERPDPPSAPQPSSSQASKEAILRTSALNDEPPPRDQLSSNSSSSESVNSQEGLQMALQAAKAEQKKVSAQLRNELQDEVFTLGSQKKGGPKNRQELLEQRHQELLRKQKQLQEQYTRLQQIQRGQVFARFGAKTGDLKKTGSESNILSKAGLLTLATASGSMQHLAVTGSVSNPIAGSKSSPSSSPNLGKGGPHSPGNKIYETDIL